MTERARNQRPRLAIDAPNWVGDLVMSTPVLEAALASEHYAQVTIVVRQNLAGLLADGPLGAHLCSVRDDAHELEALRELAPQAILLLSNSFRAAWRARQAGIPLRAGAALSRRGFLLTHRLVPPRRGGARFPIPTAHLQRDVAALLGVYAASLHPRLHVATAVRATQRAQLAALGLARGERYFVCSPGAAFGAAKLYPPPLFARALDRIAAQHGLRAVISGAPSEEPLMNELASHSRSQPLVLSGLPRDLSTLKALIEGAALLVVGDSGPRWIAAAFDVPCVSILGPNIPELTASSLERCEIVRLETLACSPCARRVCPLGHHRCMRELDPEVVAAAASRVLESSSATPRTGLTTEDAA